MEQIEFEDKSKVESKVYTDLFYSNFVLRPCCETCEYASTERLADFTVADYWGCEKDFPEFVDDGGISLVFLNTSRSFEVFRELQGEIECVETTIDKCLQPNMQHASSIPKSRSIFWMYLKREGLKKALAKYTNYGGIRVKLRRRIFRLLNRW